MPSQTDTSRIGLILSNPLQTLITILMLVLGILAPILAIIAVAKYKERSVLVFLVIPTLLSTLASAIGMVVNLFLM